MPVYYNNVGEGWFKKVNSVVNENIMENAKEVSKIIKQINSLNNDIEKMLLDYNEYLNFVNKTKTKLNTLVKSIKRPQDVEHNLSLLSELMNNLKTAIASKNIPNQKQLEDKINEMYENISDIFGYMD